jgi:small-conductance mechanosensitive channel
MLKSTKWHRYLFIALTAWFTSVLALSAASSSADAAADKASSNVRPEAEAPLEVYNRTIFIFRAPFQQLSPTQRAVAAKTRIEALPEFGPWNVEEQPAKLGSLSGILISVNNQPMFGVLPGDLDPEIGETLTQASGQAAAHLKAVLDARAQQSNLRLILKATGFSGIATLLFVGLLWLVAGFYKNLPAKLERIVERIPQLQGGGAQVRRQVLAFILFAIRFVLVVAVLLLANGWMTYVLAQFPYTQPWGGRLGHFLLELAQDLGRGAVDALPGLATVFVIFLLTRGIVRLVSSFFKGVEQGTVSFKGVHPETAQATRRLVSVLIWTFALTVAYPFIPGSNTEGFKGIGVFAGLMVSLGSAGLVNHVMSGFVIVYSRTFRVNDYVCIGETEGVVTNIGLLSTKLLTVQHEEIIIPNATLVGMKTVNYTRLGKDHGSVASTSVTIGYDAPWRQVHAMLLEAASRTAGVCQDPPPRVLQRSLSDFYVEYRLIVYLVPLDRPEERPFVFSELHGHIQDSFYEHGVQIMSPHFFTQPAKAVVVPKSDWFAAPASPPTAPGLDAGGNFRKT